jgi:deoxycytidine triphosphate deaminase
MNRKEQEKKELSEYPCPIQDDLETVGVLLSDEIAHYAKEYRMIDPFNPESLGPARYELTVGNEYSRGGENKELYDEPGKNEIRIPPFEVVVIKTYERINLPRFIVARWNIRVKWAYEGLLWVGGPQVDPGWVGHLSCPIYNLSDKEVTVRLGEQIAVMDFVKTTPFKEGKSKEYQRPPKRIIFDDYHAEKLKSALYTKVRKRIDNIEDKVDRFGSRLDTFIGIIVVAFTVLVAALAIFVSSGQGVYETLPWWTFLCVGFSIIALGMSIFAYTKAGSKKHDALIGNIEERITKLECFTRILIIAIIALTGAVILILGGVI